MEIVEHRRLPNGCYRMRVDVGEDPRPVAEDEEPGRIIREFVWGPIPIVPDSVARPDAYTDIHDRALVPGEPFVDEDEYVYLQVVEAMETIALESVLEDPGEALVGEGVTF